MGCSAVRESYSSRLDGEAGPVGPAALDAHLTACRACRAWTADVDALHRCIRVRPAEEVPDLVSAVLARAHPPRPGRHQWVRYALAAVGLTELLLSLPALVGGGQDGPLVHTSRHLGAMSLAIATGLIYVARRPERSFGVLPIVAALAVGMTISAGFDVAHGNVPLAGEAHHTVEVAGLVLTWLLAGAPRPRLRLLPRRQVSSDEAERWAA